MNVSAEPWNLAVTAAALVFAFISGTNDGATLLALGVRASRVPLLGAVILLVTAVVAAPLIVGTEVAATFLGRLVTFDDRLISSTLIAVASSLGAVALLASRGLPTSLTVAILGGLVGSGVGRGLEVQWGTVGIVVGVALITPVIGFVIAFLLSRAAMRVGVRGRVSRLLDRLHVAAFAVQCLAYGVNDGQKMLAVLAVAAGTVNNGEVDVGLAQLVMVAVPFALGTVVAMNRYARTLVLDVFPVRPPNAVAAEIAAAISVLATGLSGSPVSSTQTIVTSVIGSGSHEGVRRVRWQSAVRIGLAWIYTFPLTMALGVVLSLALDALV